jgi:hypothetical protein
VSDCDPDNWSTDVDADGHQSAAESDRYARPHGHGMEEVRGSNPLSFTDQIGDSGPSAPRSRSLRSTASAGGARWGCVSVADQANDLGGGRGSLDSATEVAKVPGIGSSGV